MAGRLPLPSFMQQMVRDYRATGAVMPSSRALARAMTESLRVHDGPKRILEVGPGTGAFTRQILTLLQPGDCFHLVEISELFCDRLEAQHLQPFRAAHPDIEVILHRGPIETADIIGPFDYIICGLPFNNFPVPLVRSIFRQMLGLLSPDGCLTYFEYVGMKFCKRLLPGRTNQRSIMHRMAAERRLTARHGAQRSMILANVPPAYAVHYRATPAPPIAPVPAACDVL